MATGPKTEIGHGATGIVPWSGLVDTAETAPSLQWPQSVRTYDKMRTDAQIQALLLGTFLPIRRRRFAIAPNGARDEAVEQIARDLGLPVLGMEEDQPRGRTRGRFNHDDHLRHALLALVYGHMFFEQVRNEDFDLVTDGWRLKRLAARMPATISEMKVADDGGLVFIRQAGRGTAGETFGGRQIPITQLVGYVWDKEGDNWIGRSALRACYRNWLRKDRLLRVDAVKHERNGMGVPIVEAPPGATEAQMTALSALAQAYKAGEASGGAVPNGARLRLVGTEGSLPDTIESIRYDDQQMARAFLEMFMELGQTETGSRALGDSFVSVFDWSLDAVCGWYTKVTNEHVIEDIVDWNWSIDENAPLLVASDSVDNEASTTELVTLIEAGAITVDDDLEDWIRDARSLPERSDEPRPVPVVAPPAPETAPVVPEPTAATRRPRARSQTAGDPRIGYRERFPHEVAAATEFEVIQQAWQSATESLVSEWQAVRAAQIEELVAAIETTVNAGAITSLGSLSATVQGADVLETRMMSMAEQAITHARAEAVAQGVEIPLINVADLQPLIRQRADVIATLMTRSISEAAARQALQRAGDGVADGAVVAAGVQEHLEDLSDSYLTDQLGGALTQAQNTGRRAVMSQAPGTYYASELLDVNTCTQCSSVDGRSYTSLADAEKDYPTGGNQECLGGPRCRGTIVAVYDEPTD